MMPHKDAIKRKWALTSELSKRFGLYGKTRAEIEDHAWREYLKAYKREWVRRAHQSKDAKERENAKRRVRYAARSKAESKDAREKRNAKRRASYPERRERKSAQARVRYQMHREKIKFRARLMYYKYTDKILAAKRAARRAKQALKRAQDAMWRAKNRDRCRATHSRSYYRRRDAILAKLRLMHAKAKSELLELQLYATTTKPKRKQTP